MKHSISMRLALLFTLVLVAIISIFAFALRTSLHRSITEQMHNELQFRANLIEPWIEASYKSTDGWQNLTTKLSNLEVNEGGRVKYWVLTDNKQFKIGGKTPTHLDLTTIDKGFSKIPGETPDACSIFTMNANIASGEKNGLRYVIAIDSASYMETLSEFTQTLIIVSLLGIMAVAVLGFIIAKIGLRPVNDLSKQAQHLAPQNQGQRLDVASLPTELQSLAGSFNGVLERQQVAWQQLESFNANVAHELKTPLTNLIGQTQLGLSHQHQIAELEELLGSNLEELERMASIVNDMLFLSHAQAGEHATQLKTVSLADEAHKTFDYVEPLFADKNLTIKVQGDVSATIDPRLFNRALANLLSNSSRYSPANSTVTLTIEQQQNLIVIAVSNLGDAIDNKELNRLFERFYRSDSSRTLSNTHHGLGLSIVRAVALMHKGNVFASSKNGINTFGFTVSLNLDSV